MGSLESQVENSTRIKHPLAPLAPQVQLLAGTLPSRQLVQQYHLDQYLPLMEAMKRGDLALFDATMEKQQFQFIQEVGGVGG